MNARLLRIESRRSVALLCFPFLLGVAFWIAWQEMEARFPGAEVYIWQDTSRSVQLTVIFVGPLVAGLSAWVADRNRRRGMGDLLSTTARPSALRDLTTWAGTALWGIAVYALLAVVVGIATLLHATWGAPLVGYLLVGLLAMVADSALGFAAGHWLPGRFTAPFVAVSLYVAHLMPLGATNFGLTYELLSPATFGYLPGTDVFYQVPQVAIRQSLWFAGLCGIALAAVALKGGGARKIARIALAASVAVTVVGLVTTLTVEETWEEYGYGEAGDVPFKPVCQEGEITVCVHPAYEKLLTEAARTVNEVAEPLVGIPGVPTRALQVGGPKTIPDEAKTKNVALFSTFDPWGNLVKEEVAYGFVQNETAMYGPPNIAGEGEFTEEDLRRCGKVRHRKDFDLAYEAQAVVGRWLTERAGGRVYENLGGCPNANELVDRFAALDPAEREAWLRQNFADLRAGEVTLKDLP